MDFGPGIGRTPMYRIVDSVAPWSSALVVLGGFVALFGVYWDEAWHTDLGRDSFWSPPHVLLYAGPTLVTMALALWLMASYLRLRKLRAVLTQGPLALGLLGVVGTIGSAPVDDLWHELFGRDAVLFSPPHTLGLVGIILLFGSVLLESARIRDRRWLTTFAAAAILGAFAVLTFEWDADVPQFAAVFYLPILSGASALALGVAHRVARDRWIAAKASLLYTALMTAVILGLAIMGHSTPILPALFPAAVAFDLAASGRVPCWLWAAIFVTALHGAYVPYLNFVLEGVELAAADVLLGLPLAWALTALGLWASGVGLGSQVARSAAVLLTLFAGTVTPALAHDPGQGEEVGEMFLRTQTIGRRATVQVEGVQIANCESLLPVRLTARRGGVEIHSTLERRASCRYQGQIDLPSRGRWFLYAEFTNGESPMEAWTWVKVSHTESESGRLALLYVPPSRSSLDSPMAIVAGIGIYALNVSLLALFLHMVRREAWRDQEVGA